MPSISKVADGNPMSTPTSLSKCGGRPTPAVVQFELMTHNVSNVQVIVQSLIVLVHLWLTVKILQTCAKGNRINLILFPHLPSIFRQSQAYWTIISPSLTWPDCIQQMFCPAAAGHSTTPNTHTHRQSCTELLSHSCTARGPLCRKGATWGPKSNVGVGWLCNLIAWIVFLFFFFVVKFLFFCSFLASSCASYSRQASTSPDITARLLGDNVIGWRTAYQHMMAALHILVPTHTCCHSRFHFPLIFHLLDLSTTIRRCMVRKSSNRTFRNMYV